MTKADMSWMLTTIIVASLIAIATGIAFMLPREEGFVVIGVTVAVLIIFFLLNPRYRFNRAGWYVLTCWLGARAIPSISFYFFNSTSSTSLTISAETNWLFDVACAAVAIFLFAIDYLLFSERSLIGDAGVLFPKLTTLYHRADSHQNVSAQNPINQIVTGAIYGDNNQIQYNFSSTGNYGAEIDRAVDLLKKGKPDAAIHLLTNLQTNDWDHLSSREKFRVLANLGHCFDFIQEHEKGARYFISAYEWQPDDEKAMALNASAYFTLGDIPQANTLMKETLKRFPNSVLGTALRVRLSQDVPSTELAKSIPLSIRDEADVLINQVVHATSRDEALEAVSLARRLQKVVEIPDAADQHLCIALVAKCSLAHRGRLAIPPMEVRKDLKDAITLLNSLISERPRIPASSKPRLRYYRATAHFLNESHDLAESDFRAAIEPKDTPTEILFYAGQFLAARDKPRDALGVLERIDDPSENYGALLLQIRIWLLLDDDDKYRHLIALLRSILTISDLLQPDQLFEVLEAAVHIGRVTKNFSEVTSLLNSHRAKLNDVYKFTLIALESHAKGDIDKAKTACDEAARLVSKEGTSPVVRWNLARELAILSCFDSALDVIEPIINWNAVQDLLEFALECADAAQNHAYIIELCETLRYHDRFIETALDLEIVTLCRVNDFSGALEVIEASFQQNVTSQFQKILRVHRSIIGLRRDRPELVESDIQLLPAVSEVSSQLGCNVALVLSKGAHPLDAANYAYELTRRFPNDPLCHRFFVLIMGLGEEKLDLPPFDKVEPGCAVKLSRSDGKDEWRILEDSANVNPDRGEVSPSSPIGKKLLGAIVGDEIKLRDDLIQPINAKVIAICHRFEYRRVQIMADWERRFPDDTFVRAYEFKKHADGSLDIDDFAKALERLHAPEREFQKQIRNLPLTIGTFSRLSQVSLLESIVHLVSEEELTILCCGGNQEEFEHASQCVKDCTRIVLDPTAMATLWMTDLFDKIQKWPFSMHITEGGLSIFRDALQNRHFKLWSRSLMYSRNGTLCFDNRSKDDVEAQKERMRKFIQWAEISCEVNSGRSQLQLSSEERERIEEMVGTDAVEAISLAREESIPIWTDDLAVGGLAEELGVKNRLWTDLMLSHLLSQNLLSADDVINARLILLSAGYQYTRLRVEEVEVALKQSSWNPKVPPLSSVIRWIHTSNVQAIGALQMTVFSIQKVISFAPFAHQEEEIMNAFIRAIAARPDGLEILQILAKGAEKIFGMNHFSKNLFLTFIEREMALLSRGRQIILPGDPEWPFQ